jgi:predicted phosphodiesterase
MLWNPDSLATFANQSPKLQQLFSAVGEVAAFTRDALGEERIAWLRSLPKIQTHGSVALVHASPDDLWRAPVPECSDEELLSVYGPLGSLIAVYGHIHRPYIRYLSGMTVANSGSVSLSYDGDRRAACLLIDGFTPTIRRLDYDVDKEIKAILGSRIPHAVWIAKMLETGRPAMP